MIDSNPHPDEVKIHTARFDKVRAQWDKGKELSFLRGFQSAAMEHHKQNCEMVEQLAQYVDSNYSLEEELPSFLRDLAWVNPLRIADIWMESRDSYAPDPLRSPHNRWLNFGSTLTTKTIHVVLEVGHQILSISEYHASKMGLRLGVHQGEVDFEIMNYEQYHRIRYRDIDDVEQLGCVSHFHGDWIHFDMSEDTVADMLLHVHDRDRQEGSEQYFILFHVVRK